MAQPLYFVDDNHTFNLIHSPLIKDNNKKSEWDWKMWKADMLDKAVDVGKIALCSREECENNYENVYMMERFEKNVWNCYTFVLDKGEKTPISEDICLEKRDTIHNFIRFMEQNK